MKLSVCDTAHRVALMEWQPNPDELLALNNGASVYVSYIESDDPPLELYFGTVPDNKAGWHLWKRLFG